MRRSRAATMSRSLPRLTGRKRSRVITGTRRAVRSKYGRKRRYSGRTRNTTRRRVGYMHANNEELNQVSRSYGKRMRFTTRFTKKFVRKNTEDQTHAFSQVTPYGGLAGALAFPNWQTANGTTKRAPCTIFDLSSVTNIRGGTNYQPQTTWNIQFTNETGSASVQYVPAVAGWQLNPETVTGTSTQTVGKPMAHDYLKYIKADMLFYTPLKIPTKVNISIIQILDQDLQPSNTISTGAATETGNSKATAFWQQMLKGYMYNPVMPQAGPAMGRYVKYVHSETFILNPKETTETGNTRYKIVKLFKHFNRYQNYAWQQNDGMNMDNADIAKNEQAFESSVHPRARLWLVIRTLSPEIESATYPPTNATDNWPSCDIYLRTCHTQLST